jgi:hypothetical protein
MRLGFYCFTAPEPIVMPTLKQQVRALTDQQRIELLKGFKFLISPGHLDHKLGISQIIIQDVYDTISVIQDTCRSLMRGEVEITPAVIDPDTLETITPAVMNIPPADKTTLKDQVKDLFNDSFPNTFTGDVMEEMFSSSKYDGTGTFNFYASQIIL